MFKETMMPIYEMNPQRINSTKQTETQVLRDTLMVLRLELSGADIHPLGDLVTHLPPPAGGRGEGRWLCGCGSHGARAAGDSGFCTRTLLGSLNKRRPSLCKTAASSGKVAKKGNRIYFKSKDKALRFISASWLMSN